MPIKNIVFDLGGVVLDLDQERTLLAFQKLGANLDELNVTSNLFTDFETGKVSADFFLQSLQNALPEMTDSDLIKDAWNAMLGDFPTHRANQIRDLKKRYRIFLLSNTNSIHIDAIYAAYGKEIFKELFEGIYLSHEIGLRKPHVACYEYVLKDAEVKAFETVFVDDSPLNIKGAEEAGLNTILAKEPLDNWFNKELGKMDVLSIT